MIEFWTVPCQQISTGFWFSTKLWFLVPCFFFIFFYMKNQSEQTLRLSENRRHHVQRWSSFFCNINAHFIWRFAWNRGFGWFISFFCDQFTLHHRDIFILQHRKNMPGLFIFSWFWVRWEIETLHHQQFLTFIASGLLCTGPPGPQRMQHSLVATCLRSGFWRSCHSALAIGLGP